MHILRLCVHFGDNIHNLSKESEGLPLAKKWGLPKKSPFLQPL